MNKGVSIGIDASRSMHKQSTGVEFYSRRLLENFKNIKEVGDGIDLIYYSPSALDEELIDHDKHIGQMVIPFKRLWTQIRLSLEMIMRPTRVLFVPSHTLPIIHPRRSAVMIHDVAFKYFSKSYSTFSYWYQNFSTWYACKTAKKIFCCSQSTANDLQKFYRVRKNKLVVIPHGPGCMKSDEIDEGALQRLGLERPYFLFIGRIEEKKNITRLVEAYASFLKTGNKVDLVLAGKMGLGGQEVLEKIESLNIKEHVFLPGYVDDRTAKTLMTKASAFLLPSLYEGFGFPILEAFSCGVPVISAKTSSMPEVAGAAALLVNPVSVDEIAQAMEMIIINKDLRESLIESGWKRLEIYSWEKCAKKTYAELVKLAFSR